MATLVVSAGYQDEGAAAGIAKIAAAEDSLAAKTIAKSNAVKAVKQAEAAELKRIKQAELNEWKAAENEKDRILAREIANKKMTFARLAEIDRRRYDEERAARKKAEQEAGGGGGGGGLGRAVFGGGGGAIGAVAGGLLGAVGLGTLTQAISTLTSALQTNHDREMQIANKGQGIAASMTTFTALQDSDTDVFKSTLEMAQQAAANGVKLNDAAAIAEPLQSLGKTSGQWDEEDKARFAPALQMSRLGVGGEVIGEIAAQGIIRKLAPGVAEDQTVFAAALSKENEATFAKAVATGGAQFTGLDQALAATTALSAAGVGGLGGAQLPTLLQALNKTLGPAGESRYEEMFKKIGLGEKGGRQAGLDRPLNETENLRKILEYAIAKGDPNKTAAENVNAFSMNLGQNLGVLDMEDQKALGAVMRQFDKWDEVTSGIESGGAAGTLSSKVENIRAQPGQAALMRANDLAALADFRAYFGAEADAARATKLEGLAGGAERMLSGRTSFMGQTLVDAETGEEAYPDTMRGQALRLFAQGERDWATRNQKIGTGDWWDDPLGTKARAAALDPGNRLTAEDRIGAANARIDADLPRATDAMTSAANASMRAAEAMISLTQTLGGTATGAAPTAPPINRNAGE